MYLHRLWDDIFLFSGRVWKTAYVLYASLMRQSKNIRSSKERNSHYTKSWQYYIVEYCDGTYHYGLLVSQHQSNLLGLQFNELKLNFIKNKHFSLCRIKIVQKLFSYSLNHIIEMAELILKFIQISTKCHCLMSLVLDNIPVRKLNTGYIVFWTGSKQSACPG